MIGLRFGMLTVIAMRDKLPVCECDCGKVKSFLANNLKRGRSKSCGCQRGHVRHGLSGSKTHRAWADAWSRCTNKSVRNYESYGGRGIAVCDRWRVFENFLADMGEAPDDMSLDRIDNDKGYEPGNCRWATKRQQVRNTRSNVVIDGKTIAEWAELYSVPYKTMWHRLRGAKWSLNEAIERPLGDGKRVHHRGRNSTMSG